MKLLSLHLCLLLFFALKVSAASQPFAVGKAYNLDKTDTLLYSEAYYQVSENKVRVEYRSASEDLIAVKTLDYSQSKISPSFTLRYENRDYGLQARVEEQSVTLTREENGDSKSKTLSPADNQVVDAGFVGFIRDQWNALSNGEAVSFAFAFVSDLKNVGLSAQKVEPERTPFGEPSEDRLTLKMQLDNGFLAMFIDPIYLEFSPQKQLITFAGRSNITDSEGESMDVLIRYQYP